MDTLNIILHFVALLATQQLGMPFKVFYHDSCAPEGEAMRKEHLGSPIYVRLSLDRHSGAIWMQTIEFQKSRRV